LLLLGCSGCSQEVAAPAPSTSPTLKAPPRDPNLKPSPSLDFYGLSIGKSTDVDILAWLQSHQLQIGASAAAATPPAVPAPAVPAPAVPAPAAPASAAATPTTPAAGIENALGIPGIVCRQAPSVRRTTYRYTCDGDLPVNLLPDRQIRGKLTELLLVRGDTLPLSHASTIRKYSIPDDAANDYSTAIDAITKVLGAPSRSTVADVSKMMGPLVHFASTWKFSDLDVSLTLIRAGGSYYSVSERWDQPGVELAQEARPSKKPAKGRDPFGFDEPGAAPPGMRDPFGHDKPTEEAPKP